MRGCPRRLPRRTRGHPAPWWGLDIDWLFRTRAGLALRAVGEDPATADTVGIPVGVARYVYTMIGGAGAGMAGTYLMAGIFATYQHGMTAGLGWIPFAAGDLRRVAAVASPGRRIRTRSAPKSRVLVADSRRRDTFRRAERVAVRADDHRVDHHLRPPGRGAQIQRTSALAVPYARESR